MRIKYKVIGPHIVALPPGVKIELNPGAKPEPVMIPINEALEDAALEEWELVEIIQGFPIQIPQSTLGINGQRQIMSLVGVCALLQKGGKSQRGDVTALGN